MRDRLDDLDAQIRRGMARAKTPGATLGLLRPGHAPLVRAYGFRDREHRLPATPRTMYGIASVTKSFTALAVLRLCEEGRLRVSDPATRHLPELRLPGANPRHPIRIQHFLTHSSGIPPLPTIYYTTMRNGRRDPPYDPRRARRVGIDPGHAPIDTYEGLLEFLSKEKYALLGPPGAQFSYSNEGFGLLGAIVERVSGRSFESFVEEAILRPAGMRATTFDTGILFRQPEVTTLYSPKWNGRRHGFVPSDEWWEDSSMRAAGSLRTNVPDLLRYLEIFLTGGRVGGGRVVSRASVAEMTRPRVPISAGVHYGYGVLVRPDYYGNLLVAHSGGLKGVSSMIAAVPRKGIAGALLSNAEGVPADRWLATAVNLSLGVPTEADFEEVPPAVRSHASPQEFAGWYCSGEGIWAEFRARRDALRLDFRGIESIGKNLLLRPAGHDVFVLRRKGEKSAVRFLRDRSGRVRSVFLGWRVVRRRARSELSRAAQGRMVW